MSLQIRFRKNTNALFQQRLRPYLCAWHAKSVELWGIRAQRVRLYGTGAEPSRKHDWKGTLSAPAAKNLPIAEVAREQRNRARATREVNVGRGRGASLVLMLVLAVRPERALAANGPYGWCSTLAGRTGIHCAERPLRSFRYARFRPIQPFEQPKLGGHVTRYSGRSRRLPVGTLPPMPPLRPGGIMSAMKE